MKLSEKQIEESHNNSYRYGENPFPAFNVFQSVSEKCNLNYNLEIKFNYIQATHWAFKKLFSCKQCHKIFSSKCQLNNHIKVHTGEKLFLCSKYKKQTFSCSK